MGCASSKEKVCRNCQAPYSSSPMRRSYSIDLRHRPPYKTEEDSSCHVVALTSSTLGSLRLDPSSSFKTHIFDDEGEEDSDWVRPSMENGEYNKSVKEDEFTMQMIEAKTWSEMIDSKIPKISPKTPTITPPGEPETINAWELMEGLDDVSPLRPVHHIRSFSFQVPPRNNSLSSIEDQPTPRVKETTDAEDSADGDSNESISNDSSVESEFDSEVIASFRRALEELPQTNPFNLSLKPLEDEIDEMSKDGGKDKVIVYFTSLRGVRRTYEDCCHVRVILKGLKVKIDERDVSMHLGFKEELKELLGKGFSGSFLPKVFVGRRCVGGAEEIRRLNEEGKLEKMFENCEQIDDNNGGKGDVCDACGDIRFVPCETCSGSCKIYHDDEGEEEDDDEYGFRRCPDCNENGLIRCPVCC